MTAAPLASRRAQPTGGDGQPATTLLLGLISDTHGLLRPEVFPAFAGVDHIVHAGDIGDPDILVELAAIAPVTAVWGNTDGPEVRAGVPERARLEVAGTLVRVVHGHQYHDLTTGRLARENPDAGLVVYGHTHQPKIERVGGVLVVNPGSAGPARFLLPVTVAIAEVAGGRVSAKLVRLIDR
jgi:uncharacterized protein